MTSICFFCSFYIEETDLKQTSLPNWEVQTKSEIVIQTETSLLKALAIQK